MKEQRIGAGEIIYREGGPSDAVFVITKGEVEVQRQVDGKAVRLAVLGTGAIFGEMGVIRGQPRSTTVQAVGKVTLVAIPTDVFLSIFHRDNPLALPLLQMLCERLLRAEKRLLEQRIFSEGARHGEVKRIRLLAASPEVESQIGSEGVTVADLPFHVGRGVVPGESAGTTRSELMLNAPGGQMSPGHFVIEDRDGRLVLRDLGSHLGTLVNGTRIAHFERLDSADLHFGDNRVQAGGLESPYRFHIIVEREADKT